MRFGLAFGNLVNEAENALLNKVDQRFEHLRLAGEMAIQRRLTHSQLGGQHRRSDAFCARFFKQSRQRFKNLIAALPRLRAFARNGGSAGNAGLRTWEGYVVGRRGHETAF